MRYKKKAKRKNTIIDETISDNQGSNEEKKTVTEGKEEGKEEELPSTSVITKSTQNTSKQRRGVVGMHSVLVKKASGQKFTVEYTRFGVPKGKTRVTLASYIGGIVRRFVPINIKRWKDVDKEIKEKIWLDVSGAFDVAPKSRKLLLQSACNKWRYFKTKLTTNYVIKFANDKKRLKRPPPQYDFVGQDVWTDFVKQRTTKEWIELHKKQSDRSLTRKYHHRLSRKGYAGLEDELTEETPPGQEIDRAVMWKKARERKDKEFDDDVAVVVGKIDELIKKKSDGEIEVTGSNDILTQALETPEHPGRVRGVGGFINPSSYFSTPKEKKIRITKAQLLERDQEREAEAKARETEVATLREEISQLRSMVTEKEHKPTPPTNVSDKDSNIKDYTDAVVVIPSSEKKKGMDCCDLAVDTIDNVVASGRVYDESANTRRAQPGCVIVSVDMCTKEDALLPFPIDDHITLVCNAIGNHVDWPENLVIRSTSKIIQKSTQRKINKQPFQYHKNVPHQCKLLYKHAKTLMLESNLTYHVPLNEAIFGTEKELYILPQAIIALLEYDWLGANIIATYMTTLFHVISEREESDLYCFCDPGQTRYFEGANFSSYMLARLRQFDPKTTVIFVPHNPDVHWILSIIYDNKIFVLDPMPKPKRYTGWENALINVLNTFNAERGGSTKVHEVTSVKGVPKQPGGWECGYYVMRYMRDIIYDDTLEFLRKWAAKSKAYTMSQLNDIRLEIAAYIQTLD